MKEGPDGRQFEPGELVVVDSTGMELAAAPTATPHAGLSDTQRVVLQRLRDARGQVHCRIAAVASRPGRPPAYHVVAPDGTRFLVEQWRIVRPAATTHGE